MGTTTRLVSSVLAARASGATVLAFKASVDELSRLATARAQDEELLRQLEEQLRMLEPAVAARLLTECRFRDEWRDEQSDRALSSLPINDCEQDPEAIERMQDVQRGKVKARPRPNIKAVETAACPTLMVLGCRVPLSHGACFARTCVGRSTRCTGRCAPSR